MNEELAKKITSEGDRKEFQYKGYQCLIKRVSGMGHLCGYVFIPFKHKRYATNSLENDLKVHGGITYCDWLEGQWALGFDCAHFGDLVPNFNYTHTIFNTYRDMRFVQRELINLVKQLKAEEER
ncbi:hypothetical protein [Vagococcus lutrae]|uniref:hypothetical protein n=1 Tax=Vagococcus lutrae TaxID=81947 RepID=UPI00201087C7|nr:hypothetical protein [Vagococcus lutrae]UQF11345.1 hypothetical protein M2919_07570 [Vagococcus lutrae]